VSEPVADPVPDPSPTPTPDPTADPTADPTPNTDAGRVTPLDVLRMVVRTARAEPARVFLPAVLIFGLDAINSTFFAEVSVDHLGDESVGAVLVLFASTVGLTFYSGLLERLVGAVERGHEAPPVSRVVHTLPYGRLLLADAILWVAGSLATLFLVLPGIIITTLFALIGPLINMEDLSVRAAFRRSATLVAPKFVLVLGMVTIPLGLEHELVDAAALLMPHEHIWLVFLTYLAGGLTIGVTLGLIEVSLAERLVNGARVPGNQHGSQLRSDRQGGHHGRDDSRDGHAGAGAVPPTG
jgi:hypothetical protein